MNKNNEKMSYYDSNVYNGSRYGVNNSALPHSTQVLNGKTTKMSSRGPPNYDTATNYQQSSIGLSKNSFVQMNTSSEVARINANENKLKFSEKLKVLLENGEHVGSNKVEHDPYAFSEIDHMSAPRNVNTNHVDTFARKSSSTHPLIRNNVATPKSIKMSTEASQSCQSNDVKTQDCRNNSPIKWNSSGLDVSNYNSYHSLGLSVAGTQSILNALAANNSKSKIQQNLGGFKTLQGNIKAFGIVQSAKPLAGKTPGKPSITNPKAANNLNKTACGKPNSFGKLGPMKVAATSGKIEKKDSKSKGAAKVKPLMNQAHKTAYHMVRSVGKPRRTTALRSLSLDSELISKQQVFNKSNAKKSLLEESLLGLKSQGNNTKETSVTTTTTKSPSVSNVGRSLTHTRQKQPTPTTNNILNARTDLTKLAKNESLQRIWTVRNKIKQLKRDFLHFGLTVSDTEEDPNSNAECLLFQNCWFSLSNDTSQDRRREMKLSQLKNELRHKIKQLQWRYKDEYRDKMVDLLVSSARKQPNLTAFLISLDSCNSKRKLSGRSSFRSVATSKCTYTDSAGQQCLESALPCADFCSEHVVYCSNQQLFARCSAVRGDSSACPAPALDKTAETPLCFEHLSLSQKPKILVNTTYGSTTPKAANKPQPRKRSRSSPGSSRSGRSRKRKRLLKERKDEGHCATLDTTSSIHFGTVIGPQIDNVNGLRSHLEGVQTQVISKSDIDESLEVEVGEEVLEIAAGDLQLDGVELGGQASKLLEEHDFTNVLNHIPEDAFNDLFTEDKGEYEPTQQETEELERALAAVDNDVKSLEIMTESEGILESLLDEQAIVQTLAQMPEVAAVAGNLQVPPNMAPVFYHNGFGTLNHLEHALQDVSKLPHQVLLAPGTNHFVTNMSIPSHADVLHS